MGGTASSSRDMLSLSMARMPELVAALEEERTLADQTVVIPRRSKRVARMLMTEAIRLIRLGTRAEVADAALELAQARRRSGERLAELHPRSHRLLTSATDALAAATPPSSGGGELAVLRSWNGKALKVVKIISKEPRRSIPRADLRVQLDVDESYLSHLLADLEAAGLVVRVKTGRTVMVHLGLVGRSDHVQKMVPPDESVSPAKAGTQREVQSPRLTSLSDLNPPRDNEMPPPTDADEIVREATLANFDMYTIENIPRSVPVAAKGLSPEPSMLGSFKVVASSISSSSAPTKEPSSKL